MNNHKILHVCIGTDPKWCSRTFLTVKKRHGRTTKAAQDRLQRKLHYTEPTEQKQTHKTAPSEHGPLRIHTQVYGMTEGDGKLKENTHK